MIRCRHRELGKHPAPEKNEFVLIALIRIGPDLGFRRAQAHFWRTPFARSAARPPKTSVIDAGPCSRSVLTMSRRPAVAPVGRVSGLSPCSTLGLSADECTAPEYELEGA